jgi:hypothetical protein
LIWLVDEGITKQSGWGGREYWGFGKCRRASEGVGGAYGGRARVKGCGKDALLVERAFGAVFEVLSERGSGVKRNSRGGGKVVFEVVASRRFGAGFRA